MLGMKSRMFSGALALLLAGCLLAGCQPRPTPPASSGEDTTTTAAATKEAAPTTEPTQMETTPDTDAPTEPVPYIPPTEVSPPTDAPTDPVTTTTTTTTATTTTTTPATDDDDDRPSAEVVLDPVTPAPEANDRVGFMIYHFTPGLWNTLRPEDAREETFLNYVHTGSVDNLKQMKKNGQVAWWNIGTPYADRETLVFNDGYEENLQTMVEAYKAAGVWDTIIGFHLEELCMRLTAPQYIKLTKYLAETFPGKRIFAVLSYYEVVEGSAPSSFTITPMSYETYGYVTDIGYDWYGNADYDKHKAIVDLMKKQLGRDNVRFWFFPCVYTHEAWMDEDFMLDHLDMCYRLLKEQEHPGGLDLYTWVTWSENSVALDRLLDPSLEYRYDRLATRIIEIGKEVREMKAK